MVRVSKCQRLNTGYYFFIGLDLKPAHLLSLEDLQGSCLSEIKLSILFETDLSWQSHSISHAHAHSFSLSFFFFPLSLLPDRDVTVPAGSVWMVKRGGILSVRVNVEF